MISNYEKFPFVEVDKSERSCLVGWPEILKELQTEYAVSSVKKRVIGFDVYHGVDTDAVMEELRHHFPSAVIIPTRVFLKSPEEITAMVHPFVTDDPLFGRMSDFVISRFFRMDDLYAEQQRINASEDGLYIICGEGAALFDHLDILVYADLTRWEIQKRMKRNEVGNFGVDTLDALFTHKYKQAFYVDWRVMDRHKMAIFDRVDYFMDLNNPAEPKMIRSADYIRGLNITVSRPFRVVPFFDPGPWGGQWLKEVVDLDRSEVNFAWGFDCVPEENSLLFGFGAKTFEIPAINLVLSRPRQLLGENVYTHFGADFPIRFDFLDTMEGGNLSLQVHPTKAYIKENFGMPYTQDESYYLLEAAEDAYVYLGTKNDIDGEEMIADLERAQAETNAFDADKYVNKLPVKKHDHILIPAGTIHCSGKNAVVLEISATPYNFTFKLWDWARLGLDGRPRPINIRHGENVINWSRDERWVTEHLFNNITVISENEHVKEEATGLYKTQFIETRRHWFDDIVEHQTHGNLNVLNLVEGEEVIVESPDHAFEPYIIHYAETFIVPADVTAYTIRPYGNAVGKKCATIKAYVRDPEKM